MQFPRFLLIFLYFLTFSLGHSQEKAAEKADPQKKEEKKEPLKDQLVETEHSGTFGGEKMEYTATAGTMVISKKEEEPKASVFFVAYEKKGIEDPATRPIVFCFNGGPGSSAVWLHLGGFGPRRVAMNPDGTMPSPPFRLKENPDSILKVADLVFIDPVSTGYSRAQDEKKAGEFHGLKGDLESMAEFIRLYTTRYERWLSPKFLAGESYGSFRAAGLAHRLHDSYGLYLNGVILVSGVLSFDTLWGSDLSYVTFLPAMSDVAAYHQRLEPDLLENDEARRAEVEQFAFGEYASALLKGTRLTEAEMDDLAASISRYTGLEVEEIKRRELRISSSFFREELLRDEGVMLGRFDARIKGADGDLAGDSPGYDPSYQAVYGPFSAALNDYVRRDLKFESDLVYEILTSRVRPWKYGDEYVGQPVNVLDELATALLENPSLEILVNCGYEDLATPYHAIRHSIDHLNVPPGTLDRVSYTHYTGGHMMYTIEDSNTAWNADVETFILKNDGID
ncbi:MAG: peptidase S10 [Verrucomicrobiales bacterium]|nr:peptidase S10 [Verrucomicrobiales bacterium]